MPVKLEGKKKHINKFPGLSWDWAGVTNMCVSFGSFLMGEKTHKQTPPKKKTRSLYVFFSPSQSYSKDSGRTHHQNTLRRQGRQGALNHLSLEFRGASLEEVKEFRLNLGSRTKFAELLDFCGAMVGPLLKEAHMPVKLLCWHMGASSDAILFQPKTPWEKAWHARNYHISEETKGGGENSGEGKAPLPKNSFGTPPPPPMIRFPPPVGSRPVMFLRRNGHGPDKSHFLGPPTGFGGGSQKYVSPPPQSHTVRSAPPLCDFQNIAWLLCRTHRIGANREKIRLSKFSGSGLKKIEWTLCFTGFPGKKANTRHPKLQFSKPIFGHPAGPTELDRPHRKQFQSLAVTLALNKKNSRSLELSISKNNPQRRCGEGPGSVDPRFAAGLPFPVPEILEFVAFRDSGKFFQQYSRDFPGVFLGNPRTHPTNSHSLLEFSD